jgi:hypothetical protein
MAKINTTQLATDFVIRQPDLRRITLGMLEWEDEISEIRISSSLLHDEEQSISAEFDYNYFSYTPGTLDIPEPLKNEVGVAAIRKAAQDSLGEDPELMALKIGWARTHLDLVVSA